MAQTHEAGARFERLVLTGRTGIRLEPRNGRPSLSRRVTYECRCDCGRFLFVRMRDLLRGHRKSCGCSRVDSNKRLGASRDRGPVRRYLKSVYDAMKVRCYSQKCEAYPNYGGRGIAVCQEWLDDPDSFVAWAVTNGFRDGLTIDRINNDGDYEPGNCRWTTHQRQNRNRRSNRLLTAFGETKCLTEWSEDSRCVVSRNCLRHRVGRGFDGEAAITTPYDRAPCSTRAVAVREAIQNRREATR